MFPCSQRCERSNAWAYSFHRQDRPDARFTSTDRNFLHYRRHPLPPFRQTFASDIFCGNLRVITGSARAVITRLPLGIDRRECNFCNRGNRKTVVLARVCPDISNIISTSSSNGVEYELPGTRNSAWSPAW